MLIVTEILSILKITTIERNLCEFYLISLFNAVFKEAFFWSGSITLTNHCNLFKCFIYHGKTYSKISVMGFFDRNKFVLIILETCIHLVIQKSTFTSSALNKKEVLSVSSKCKIWKSYPWFSRTIISIKFPFYWTVVKLEKTRKILFQEYCLSSWKYNYPFDLPGNLKMKGCIILDWSVL